MQPRSPCAEIQELKKNYAEWEGKYNAQASVLEAEKKKVHDLSLKKIELEQYIEDFAKEMCEKFKGNLLSK